jgi:hypothetical protein
MAHFASQTREKGRWGIRFVPSNQEDASAANDAVLLRGNLPGSFVCIKIRHRTVRDRRSTLVGVFNDPRLGANSRLRRTNQVMP